MLHLCRLGVGPVCFKDFWQDYAQKNVLQIHRQEEIEKEEEGQQRARAPVAPRIRCILEVEADGAATAGDAQPCGL